MTEEYCRFMIGTLREEYQERIDPYLKRLIEIESNRSNLIHVRVGDIGVWYTRDFQEKLDKHPIIRKLAEGKTNE